MQMGESLYVGPVGEHSIRSHVILVGCAGWNIRRDEQAHFPSAGSHLERYAALFSAVELNSSFYRPHRPGTYARWASAVPETFRFSVKVPKTITHTSRLCNCQTALQTFVDEVSHLGTHLGCLLVQLPPSLQFDLRVASAFFRDLRAMSSIPVVCEPRHQSWFAKEAEMLLSEFNIARAAADPALLPEASEPSGAGSIAYYRLHGSPQMYYSSYESQFIMDLARRIYTQARERPTWCIFDNTARGAATRNALELLSHLNERTEDGC